MINDHSKILIAKLEKGQNGIDIVPLITRCTLDIICETAMGVHINAQEQPDSQYVKAMILLGEIVINRMMNPLYWNGTIFNFTKLGKQHAECLKILHGFTMKIIKTRKKEITENIISKSTSQNDEIGIKKRKAFLDYLLEENIKDENVIDENGIQEEVDTFMFEGHDTTAVSIVWAIYLLGLNKAAQNKVHEELDLIFGDDHDRQITIEDISKLKYLECLDVIQDKVHEELDSVFGDDHDRLITAEDISKLKYLECCIKESLRRIPTVFFVGRALINDLQIGEYNIPKGTNVHINFYALHHDPQQFPHPEKYIPERFLPENSSKRHPFAFVPFSAGPRNCVGQKYAFHEMKIILADILRNFQIKSLDHLDKIIYKFELVFRPKNPIRIQFIKR